MSLSQWIYPLLDGLVYPLFWLPRWLGLSLVSILIGIVFMVLYACTSDQWAMAHYRNQIESHQWHLLNGQGTMKELREIIISMGQLLKTSLVSAVICIGFLLFLIPWVGSRFGYLPVQPMQPFVLTVKATGPWSLKPKNHVRVTPGWGPHEPGTTRLRLLSETHGVKRLRFDSEQEEHSFQVPLQVPPVEGAVWPSVRPPAWYSWFARPTPIDLPKSSPIRELTIHYKPIFPWFDLYIPLTGRLPGWMTWFFLVSFLSGMALRQRQGIQ